MRRRTPSQRRWDHLQGYLLTLALVLAGLALALGPIRLGPLDLPQSTAGGALLSIVGLLWAVHRLLQQRQEARDLQSGRAARAQAQREREQREREQRERGEGCD